MDDLKVTDRRWWVRQGNGEGGDGQGDAEEPKLKPTYVEELEAQVAAKNAELQQILAKYRDASNEFDAARARLRKEMSKDIERGRRATLVSFLEVLDNLDRALEAGVERVGDPFVQGVALVQQQFLSVLESFGIRRLDPLGEAFDPTRHEAVSMVPAASAEQEGRVVGVIHAGYLIGDEVLRPAAVAVARGGS